jgi:rSAM/selenodomain-associated transferase 1
LQRRAGLIGVPMLFPDFCIVQFAKSPASAQIKTRLAPALDAEQRRALHTAMTRHICRTVAAAELAPLQLWVDADPAHELFSTLKAECGPGCFVQRGSDLGARMYHTAQQVLASYQAVIFIGSDCPFIDADYLRSAALGLRDNDAVLGPATDGGYVLLGLRRLAPDLFSDIAWGTHTVLKITEARLQALRWPFARLGPRSDIDRPDDLALLDRPEFPSELRRFAVCA